MAKNQYAWSEYFIISLVGEDPVAFLIAIQDRRLIPMFDVEKSMTRRRMESNDSSLTQSDSAIRASSIQIY